MNKDISNTIITPASYPHNTGKKYPVVYLLHGYGGNYTTWTSKIKPELDQLASSLDLILVCPDGANSWYWESPVQLPFSPAFGPLAIIIDCGTEDFFFRVNQALHEKLLYYNIPHDYIIRPGAHNAQYWNNAIDYQLLFFRKVFDRQQVK